MRGERTVSGRTKAALPPGRAGRSERTHCQTGRDFREQSALGMGVQRAAGGQGITLVIVNFAGALHETGRSPSPAVSKRAQAASPKSTPASCLSVSTSFPA